jgi:hypothetical protein
MEAEIGSHMRRHGIMLIKEEEEGGWTTGELPTTSG